MQTGRLRRAGLWALRSRCRDLQSYSPGAPPGETKAGEAQAGGSCRSPPGPCRPRPALPRRCPGVPPCSRPQPRLLPRGRRGATVGAHGRAAA